VLAVNGALHAPERYAIDFVQLDAKNQLFSGPESALSSVVRDGPWPLRVLRAPAAGQHHGGRRRSVRVGQQLGRLGNSGNSGNSTGPHLHFHIMDGPSPLGSNGLPFRFTRFASDGTIADDSSLFAGQPVTYAPPPAGVHRGELPLNLQVLDFGTGL